MYKTSVYTPVKGRNATTDAAKTAKS